MKNLNNVSLEDLEQTLEVFRANPAQARKTNRVEGTWNLEAGKPQFPEHSEVFRSGVKEER